MIDLKEFFNLTENQNKVLQVFIQKGTVTTGDITKKTGISRPNCYDLLNKLIEKGLITKTPVNGQVQYTINQLDYQEVLKEKQQELTHLKRNISEYNKNILQIQKEQRHTHHVEVYSGKRELHKFYTQTFNTRKFTVFGAEGVLEKKYPHTWNAWIKKLKEKNIPLYIVYNEKSRSLRKQNNISLIKEKYIEREYLTNVTTQIMDEQVNLFHWQETPLIIAIKSKKVAQAYRLEFDLMWKNAKE